MKIMFYGHAVFEMRLLYIRDANSHDGDSRYGGFAMMAMAVVMGNGGIDHGCHDSVYIYMYT